MRKFAFLTHLILLAGMTFGCAPVAGKNLPAPTAPPQTESALPNFLIPFQTSLLNPLDTPHTYIADTCKYLRARWTPWNSEPGTVVILIRMAEVYRGSGSPAGVEVNQFNDLFRQLRNQGFAAINTQKLLDFLERNAKIPARSVVLIRDGYFPPEDYNKYFRDAWENWGWPVVNGWVGSEDLTNIMWLEHSRMEREGFVDHQPQGVQRQTYFTDETSKVIINRELVRPIDMFARYFEKKPIAFIWPRGGFGARPVRAARQVGYQLGVTQNQRGPVMYNWIPQASQLDEARPALLPEASIGDPLMTLPSYHPHDAIKNLDLVRMIGNEARLQAEKTKSAEIEYYKIVCEPTYGAIPLP